MAIRELSAITDGRIEVFNVSQELRPLYCFPFLVDTQMFFKNAITLSWSRSRVHSGSTSSHRSASSRRSRSRRNRSLGRGMSSDEEYLPPPIKVMIHHIPVIYQSINVYLNPFTSALHFLFLRLISQVTPPHKCLLDVLHISLNSLDLTVGHRVSSFHEEDHHEEHGGKNKPRSSDISVGSCRLRRQAPPGGRLLKDSGELKLQVERNLDKGFSHNVPDLSIKGLLSSLQVNHLSMFISIYLSDCLSFYI